MIYWKVGTRCKTNTFSLKSERTKASYGPRTPSTACIKKKIGLFSRRFAINGKIPTENIFQTQSPNELNSVARKSKIDHRPSSGELKSLQSFQMKILLDIVICHVGTTSYFKITLFWSSHCEGRRGPHSKTPNLY